MVVHYETNRYLVQIDEGGLYLVDLDEFGSGFCSCRDFECRHLPQLMKMLDDGAITFPKVECKHIKHLLKHLKAKSQQALEDYREEDKAVGQQA